MKKILRNLKMTSIAVGLMMLTSCGGGGASGSTTSTQAGIVVTTINDPSLSVISVVADKQWKQKITLVGNKNASGTPTNVNEIHYSALGGDLKIELGSDGLPLAVTDLAGNKYTLSNYTNSTVDITFYDSEGTYIIGPTTIPLDSNKLSALKTSYSNSSQQQLTAGLQQGLTHDELAIWGPFAGNVFDAIVCATGVVTAGPTWGTSLAITAGGCLKTVALMNAELNTPSEIVSNAIDIGLTVADISISGVVETAISKSLENTPIILDNMIPPDQQAWLDPGIYPRQDLIGIYWKGSEGDSSVKDYYITRTRQDDNSVTTFSSLSAYYRDDYKIIPGKTYCYQVQARNAAGFSAMSSQLCATVPSGPPPLVITGSVGNTTTTSATLNGLVNPDGLDTNAYFEYGVSTSYGNQTNLVAEGNGTSYINLTESLSNLTPNTIYHYRVVAVNNQGSTTHGSDQTFESVVPITAAPTISNVSPTTVIGSNIAQPFTINGSNFVSGANITLRDKTTGEVFPNRQPTSFTNSSITLSTVFSTAAHTWSVNVVNPDSSSTGEYVFNVVAPSAGALSFSSLSPNPISTNTVGYQPSLTALGRNITNVTQISFNWSGTTSGNSVWNKYDPNWISKVVINSDSSMTLSPVVTANGDPTGTTNWTVTIRDSSGATQSQSFTVNYQPTTSTLTPSISSLSLTSVPADSVNRTLIIYGSNFAAGNVVNYRWLNPAGGNTASATVNSASQISVPFNPGSVTDTIYVKVCQSSTSTACSSELSIAVTAATSTLTPSISSLSLTSVPADSVSRTLTIYGGNFAAGNVVNYRWLNPAGGNTASATVNSASQISVPFNPGSVTDTIYVKVCQSFTSTACSSELSITVTATATLAMTAPTLTAPANYATGQSLTPTLQWSGGSATYWQVNIRDVSTGVMVHTSAALSSSQTSYAVPGGVLQSGVQYKWNVAACPDTACLSGYVVSSTYYFTTASASVSPAISSLSSYSFNGTCSAQSLTIYGSNFVSGATVNLYDLTNNVSYPGRATTFNSSGQLTLSATYGGSAATWSLTVINPDGSSSSSVNFSVIGPTITGVSPNPVPRLNSTQTITFYGAGFLSGAAVQIDDGTGPYAKTPTVLSSGQMTISAYLTSATATWRASIRNCPSLGDTWSPQFNF